MGSTDGGPSAPWFGLHSFFSFELSYLRVLKKPRLAGTPEVLARLSGNPLEVPGLVMQNDLAWS
jgi:hypothetical protein